MIIPRAQSRKQSYKLNVILLTLSHIQDWPADPVSKTTDFDSVDLECGLRFSISNKLPGVVVLLNHGPHTRNGQAVNSTVPGSRSPAFSALAFLSLL